MIACAPEAVEAVATFAHELGQPLRVLGAAGGATLLGVELERLREAWEHEPRADLEEDL